ncbi:nuclease-related domain-containing protein [Zooshikella ganghwensis]|uniref:nuclease-related domain-containing protein n=1 Tax=Zooshikella ganghwensis TaxID=202772 RepID=UPI000415C80A|nr:nuclease-related domain-containing protein [Zooshikella ganghwensis]
MIIKAADSIHEHIQQLEYIHSLGLNNIQSRQVQIWLKSLKHDYQVEKNSAYFIDHHFSDNKDWAVIHQLRLWQGSYLIQPSHLLINRHLQCFFFKSKSFHPGLTVTNDGTFQVVSSRGYKVIESPLAQNAKQKAALCNFISNKGIRARKLFKSLSPIFLDGVLVPSSSFIRRPQRPQLDVDHIIHADQVAEFIDTQQASLPTSKDTISSKKLKQFAEALVSYHSPVKTDYFQRLGIVPINEVKAVSTNQYQCAKCNTDISETVARFCLKHVRRFKGKQYCYSCQQFYSV